MENTKISACIVTYNNGEIACDAIESLLNASKNFDMQVYISDNDSSDDTVDIIRKKFSDKVKIIENKCNNGFGAGHNSVLNYIDSDYHFIVNPDIRVSEETINIIIEFLENNKDVGLLCPKILNDDGTEQILPKATPKFRYLLARRVPFMKGTEAKYTRRNEQFKEVEDIEFCTGCFMAIRTSIFKELKGFDDRFFMYFEDADLTRRVLQSYRVVMYRKAEVIHMWERASSKSIKFLIIQIKSMFKYFKKWR